MKDKTVITMHRNNSQLGVVSLFIVIFSALLMTVVTVSFVTIMVTNQEQATNNDLSQSALDSAQAGVEDAKRALLSYQAQCPSGTQTTQCTQLQSAMSKCNGVFSVLGQAGSTVSPSNGSVAVGSTAADQAAYNQSYTCVEIALQTADYIGKLNKDGSVVIPLTGAQSFDTVQIKWYDFSNVPAIDGTLSSGAVNLNLDNSFNSSPLLSQSKWAANRPSIMRAQLMQFGSNFSLSDFDSASSSDTGSDTNTLFLYPSGYSKTPLPSQTVSTVAFTSDAGVNPTGTPMPILCSGAVLPGQWACTTYITLPAPINADASNDRTALLRLTSLYNPTDYQVSLANSLTSDSTVNFNDVQPSIDSTGRADDVYRRVASRVTLSDTSFPYPDGTIDISDNFCKDFTVTNVATQYVKSATCDSDD